MGPGSPRGGFTASSGFPASGAGRARNCRNIRRMAWPEDSLTQGETIVVKFRQHWKLLVVPFGWFLLGMVALWVVFKFFPFAEWVFALLVVAAVLYLVLRPIVDWLVTWYVLTTERLITRTGLIARSGVEIPLERITNVNFSQTMIERLLKAGDLTVESAGESGQSEFKNIPRPDEFQALLYKTREARTIELQHSGLIPAPEPAPPATDPSDQLRRLKQLHSEGIITDAEYEEKRQRLVDEL